MEEIKSVNISMELIKQIDNYLNSRPHGEIRRLYDVWSETINKAITEQKNQILEQYSEVSHTGNCDDGCMCLKAE